MSDAAQLPSWPRIHRGGWLNQLVARPGFQAWAARFPLTRRFARADGAELFDLVQGFVASQVLRALIELDIFRRLRGGALDARTLGRACEVPEARMRILLQAGTALGLLKKSARHDQYGLARKGAALLGVPGLEAMIRHHGAFYDDMRDPVALLRGQDDTALSRFWPYVFGGDVSPADAELYSDLMTQSQRLVAQDTLDTLELTDVKHLMDVGGGTGAFLIAAAKRWSHLTMTLFDLPQVVDGARAHLGGEGVLSRVTIQQGSFRTDALQTDADAISLIRVLYDHNDESVRALLEKIYAALPPGGRLIISEPMAGGDKPDRACDVYFAFYTLAMQTGRARSAAEISAFCAEAGFVDIKSPKPRRSYVTRVVTARRSENV